MCGDNMAVITTSSEIMLCFLLEVLVDHACYERVRAPDGVIMFVDEIERRLNMA